MNLALQARIGGHDWHLYAVDFTTAEGEFSTHIYAISKEHAAAIVEELKATARVGDRVVGWG